MLDFFCDFYVDFDRNRAVEMLHRLNINIFNIGNQMGGNEYRCVFIVVGDNGLQDIVPGSRVHASKGTKEKVQLIMVMSRNADLYCLDEPIGGVDPAWGSSGG